MLRVLGDERDRPADCAQIAGRSALPERGSRRRQGALTSSPMTPYLSGEARGAFDRWLEASCARWMPPLTFQEVRKGIRAVSSLYLERRAAGRIGPRLAQGRGKRAAFATYYAALHFLTAWHAVQRLGPARLGRVRRIYDLGCGTGAAGAAVALALRSGQDDRPPAPAPNADPALRRDPVDRPTHPGVSAPAFGAAPGRGSQEGRRSSASGAFRVQASDVAAWMLPEARFTYASFGVPARVSRTALPRSMPRGAPGDLLLLAWVANEVPDDVRRTLLPALEAALRRGSRLLLVEPLAGSVSPWWPDWSAALRPLSVSDAELKQRVDLPPWLARMDHAAGLDHRTLGARLLAGPF